MTKVHHECDSKKMSINKSRCHVSIIPFLQLLLVITCWQGRRAKAPNRPSEYIMHYSSSHIFLALVFLSTTLTDGLIEGWSQAGPTQRVDSPVNAENGQQDYSGYDLAHDIVEKTGGGDYSFQALFKRQGSCKDGLTACGTGCMPENADCCSGKTYCDAGTLCTDTGRCRSIVTTSTAISTLSST